MPDEVMKLIHISSSKYKDKILKEGLIPSSFSIDDVAAQIELLTESIEIKYSASSLIENRNEYSMLVRSRLADKNDRLCFMRWEMSNYFQDIVRTCSDGGEFYRAVRLALNSQISTQIDPLYPDAEAIICVVEFEIRIDADERRRVISPCGQYQTLFPDNKYQDLSIDYSISPEYINVITVEEFEEELR